MKFIHVNQAKAFRVYRNRQAAEVRRWGRLIDSMSLALVWPPQDWKRLSRMRHLTRRRRARR